MKIKTSILLFLIFFFLFSVSVVFADSLTDYTVTFHENGGSTVDMSSSYEMSYVFQEVIDPSLPLMSEAETSVLFELGDINQDTEQDIVFSLYQNLYLGWIENHGNGTYTEHLISSLSVQFTSLKLYDIDLDDDLDIVGVSNRNVVVIFYNDGSGNFTTSTVNQVAPLDEATDLEIGLVDDDIYPDIVVNSTNTNQVLCFFQTSLHTFSTETILYTAPHPYDLVLSDIDLDGDLDLAFSAYDDYKVMWVENDSLGSFTSSHLISTTLAKPTSLDYVDFDNDGDKDFISLESGNIADSYYAVYLNNGNTSFTRLEMYSYSSLGGGTYYDTDENGFLDYIVPQSSSVQTTLFNSSSGYGSTSMAIASPSQIMFMDIDQDLEVEMIISSLDDLSFHVYNLVPTGYVLGYSPETERKDYDFSGWYSDEALLTSVTFPYPLSSDTDLYASWTPHAYQINYHLDGGLNHPSNPDSYTLLDTPLTLENPTKEGYSFVGWYLDNTYLGNSVSSISTGEEDLQDYELYALWTLDLYTLTFVDDEGQTIWTNDYLYQTDLSAVSYPLGDKYGYDLSGWSSSIPLTMPNHDVTITANYTIGEYRIYFDTQGGSAIPLIQALYQEAISAPLTAPTYLGYDFDGYYTDLTYSTTYLFDTMPGEDITLYVKWTLHPYQITYMLIGGVNDSRNPATFTLGDSFDFYDPSRAGYQFDGFYLNSEGTGEVITDLSSFMLEDITLYAKWTIRSYTVTFYEADQTTILNQYTFDYMDGLIPIQSVIPSRLDGYTFVGWSQAIPLTMPSEDLSFYPRFTPNNYTITYDSRGGNSIAWEEYRYDSLIDLPIPTRIGYSFDGWYTDTTLNTKFELLNMPSTNLTLYAKWTEIFYTLYFSVNGVNFEIELGYGSTVPWLDNPTKTNYEFVGWYIGDELINPSTFTMPERDVTVVARFVDETPPIVNGVSDYQIFTYGQDATITFNEGTALLNGHPFASGTVVTDPGTYTLVVTDTQDNVTTLHFTIEEQTKFSWWYIIGLLAIGGTASTGVLFKKEILALLLKKR
ncbi:MAG: InlB B-repeat-containing protein [Candidatus Izemoplasmatales bacterium]